MSAPDYEAMANGLDEVWAGSATITSAGARDAAAALRRAARIEPYVAHRTTCLTQIGPDHSGFRGKMTHCDCGLREALEADAE